MQHGCLTRRTFATLAPHALPVTALDSPQCMPEINHPSSQAAFRPVFSSCVPAIDSAFCDCVVPESSMDVSLAVQMLTNHPSSQAANRPVFTSCVPAIARAFCDCIVPFHFSKAASCMHDSSVSASCQKPAVTFQAPTSDAWDAPLLLPCPFLHCSSRAACLLLEACMRRTCVPTSSQPLAPQRHARRIDPRPHRLCPERRLRLRRSCMPTSFGPGCIAFAAQAHVQGRVSLHEHATLPRTGMPR